MSLPPNGNDISYRLATKRIAMMIRNLLTAVGFATFFMFSACQEQLEEPRQDCEAPIFNLRLSKTITKHFYSLDGHGFSQYETSYFFDNQGRVDSIAGSYGLLKIMYHANGRVDKTVWRQSDSPQTFISESQYVYSNGRLARIQTTSLSGAFLPYTYHYEWNKNGFLKKMWREGGSDKTVFTHDGCGNIVKEQDFYNADNQEHRLAIAEFAETFSPYYQIGLHKIYPNQYSVHNPLMTQIVHWDCSADYDPSPQHFTYEYNEQQLPVKMRSAYREVTFFYE